MRIHGCSRYTTLLALLALSAAALAAGSFPQMFAEVPFAFVVADQQLPSGDYSVWRVTETGRGPLMMRSRHDGTAVFIACRSPLTAQNKRGAPPKLVFHRYGDRYFLAQVWSSGTAGIDLPPSQEEREYVDSEVRYARVVIDGRSAR